MTGANAGHVQQVFIVNRDGTGLAQVTHLTDGEIYFLKISDDATKIVFAAETNPLGTNADGNAEIFAINADGTGLRQLTNTTDTAYDTPAVAWMSFAGGGSKVAFSGNSDPLGTNADHGSEVFVVDYAGTNFKQLTNSTGPNGFGSRDSLYPAITGDGVTVFFTSDQFTLTQNADGSFELWKIKTDGTGKTLVTNNGIEYYELVVSSSGNRLAFRDLGGDGETKIIDATGLNLKALTSTTRYSASWASIDGPGDLIAFASTADLVAGGNSGHSSELFTVHPDGSGLAQLTHGMDIQYSAIAGNGATIAFTSSADPLGTNASHHGQVFRVNADGSGLRQVTSGTWDAYFPRISRDGNIIVFNTQSDLTGGNPDNSYEEFRINADGTGVVQLTSSSVVNSYSVFNAVDDSGTWVAFMSDANLDGSHPNDVYDIWRVRTDGTGLQAITTGVAGDGSAYPDITGDGSLICFDSNKDLTGGNPGHANQIFTWSGGTFRQLTSATDGYSAGCRLSRDGQWAYFTSDAPFLEANPQGLEAFYRVKLATGLVERVDGLGFGPAQQSPANDGGNANEESVDDTGVHAVYARSTNAARGNPDLLKEVFEYDYTNGPTFAVSSGPAPTHVSWDVEAGPVRYDIVRGDVANLRTNGSSVDLGTVACVKNDSAVNSTEGSDDGLTPAPGHVFFYVYRGSQGLSAGPGSYGQGTGGRERLASAGDCSP